jgi:hypothetical protein
MNAPTLPTALPRGSYTGAPLGGPRPGHRFYQCRICGGWVDSHDLIQVAEHEGVSALSPAAVLPPDTAKAS